jgi:hypothetical protein
MSNEIPKKNTVEMDGPESIYLHVLNRCTQTLTVALGVTGIFFACVFFMPLGFAGLEGMLTLWGLFNLCLVLLLGILLFADLNHLIKKTRKGTISTPVVALLIMAALVKPDLLFGAFNPWDYSRMFENINVLVLVYALFRCFGRAFMPTDNGTAINPILNRTFLAANLTRANVFAVIYRIAKMIAIISSVVLGVIIVFIPAPYFYWQRNFYVTAAFWLVSVLIILRGRFLKPGKG